MRRLISLVAVACAFSLASPSAQPTSARPNIVLIITDDVGYGDFGAYGAPDIKTPNIDSLAKAGTRFTDFYSNGPTCTPTRAGLITGRYQQRLGLERPLRHATTTDGELGLPANGRSLPQLLKNAGYATGLIGKWHLGYKPEYSPAAHGFETFWGFKSGLIDYYQHTDASGQPDLFENDAPARAEGYSTDLITARAVKFIEEHKGAPFFLDIAFNAAHWPYQVPDHSSTAADHARHLLPFDANTSTRADYAKILERADQGVGQVLDALDRLGLAGNTLVIFTNDNGGEWLSRNDPFFQRKGSVYEGGIRVPAIMRWPGRVPAGAVTRQVGITMDLTATMLAAAGAAVPPGARLEGVDLLPLIRAGAAPRRRTLFWRVTPANERAVRDGNWKLVIDNNRYMLFDIATDLGERRELSASNTAVVRQLHEKMLAWEKDVDGESKAGGSARGAR
ncbi:MAG: sulfatase-like hydrolase/transferase [Cyanobacteria bacterium]|nr:sulfatase-like hydrolase/transferase [Cyanobacteriota bacterium]